jgi:hypothetical protein
MNTLEVKKDSSGQLFLEFPDNLMNQMGWGVGDNLIWEELSINQFVIKKEKE